MINVGREGGAGKDILIGSDCVVATGQSQGSHAPKRTMLYRLFRIIVYKMNFMLY